MKHVNEKSKKQTRPDTWLPCPPSMWWDTVGLMAGLIAGFIVVGGTYEMLKIWILPPTSPDLRLYALVTSPLALSLLVGSILISTLICIEFSRIADRMEQKWWRAHRNDGIQEKTHS